MHEVVNAADEIDTKLRTKMNSIENVHFYRNGKGNIIDALEGHAMLSAVNLSSFLFSQNTKYHGSIQAIQQLHELYKKGCKRLDRLKKHVPAGVIEAHHGLRGGADYFEYEKKVGQSNCKPDEIEHYFNHLRNYKQNVDKTRKLIETLKLASKLHKKYSANLSEESERSAFKRNLTHAIYSIYYPDPEKPEEHKTYWTCLKNISKAGVPLQARQNQGARRH